MLHIKIIPTSIIIGNTLIENFEAELLCSNCGGIENSVSRHIKYLLFYSTCENCGKKRLVNDKTTFSFIEVLDYKLKYHKGG